MSKPQLPARVDPELYAYLRYLRDRLGILEAAVGTDEGDDSGSDGGANPGESYSDITPTSLASGTATAAWTSVDVSSYVSAGATHVELWAHIEIGSNADQGFIEFGTDGATVAKHGPKTATAQDNVDTDASTLVLRVPLTEDKLFYYRVTGTLNTDAAWQIVIQGEYVS